MTAVVDIQGDSRDAQRAMRDLRQSVERLGGELNGQVRSATRFGLAVFGFGEAAESVRRLVDLSKRSVEAYGEANAEVAGLIAGTSERFDELGAAIGRAIVGGDQAGETFSALQGVAVELTNVVRQNEGAISSLARNAIAGLIDTLGVAVRIGVGFANALDGLRMVALLAAAGVAEVGIAISNAVLVVAREAIEMVGSLNESLGSLVSAGATAARTLGQAGLANRLEAMSRGFQQGAADARGNAEAIDEVRRSAIATRDAIRAGIADEANAFADRVEGRNAIINLADSLAELADQYRAGEISVEAYTAATREAAQTTEEEYAPAIRAALDLLTQFQPVRDKAIAALTAEKDAATAAAAAMMELDEARKADSAEKIAQRLASQQAAAEALAAANRDLATSYYDLGAAVGQGTDSITEAVTKAAADQLRALIIRYTAEIALLGSVGRAFAAAALGVAVGKAQQALSKLGGGGSGAASGAVGLGGGGGQTVQNINVSVAQTNGMGAGIDTTRAIADAVNQGVRRGLIEVSR